MVFEPSFFEQRLHYRGFIHHQQDWMQMGVWDIKMIDQGWCSVSIRCFCWRLPSFCPKEEKAIFCIIHCKQSIHPLVFTLLKYTPCHIFVSIISRVNFLESLLLNFNVSLDLYIFFIYLHCCWFLNRHHARLNAVNSYNRNITLQIKICHVVGANIMGYPFELWTILTIDAIIF